MFSTSAEQRKDDQVIILASQISDANQHDVPLLLLKIKDVIEDVEISRDHSGNDYKLQLLSSIWHYDLMRVLNSALKQNPLKWNNGWQLMADLVEVEVLCCCGLKKNYQQLFDKQFLPDVVSSVLSLVIRLCNRVCKLEETNGNTNESYKILRSFLENTINLSQSYLFLTSVVISSKIFLQLLMMESRSIFILIASFLQELIKIDRDVLSTVESNLLGKIMDEFVFKISTAKDNDQAKCAMMTMLLCLDIYPPLTGMLLSNRYRGLRTFLGKWKGKGMDDAIQRFVTLLNSKSSYDQQAMKRMRAATRIQAWYRGYLERRRLRCLTNTITKAQQAFRYRKRTQEQEKLFTLKQNIMHEQELEKRRKKKILSQSLQLKMIETIPANTVNRFLNDLQEQSATIIQSAWRGYSSRKNLQPLLRDAIMSRAAMIIQRQVRSWLSDVRRKKELLKAELVPSGLNDERRAELQQLIARLRSRFPKNHVSQAELSTVHSKANEMLNNHFCNLRQSRRRDDHCRALIARIKATTDLINAAPSLPSVTPHDLDVFCSNNVTTKAAAIDRHKKALVYDLLPWWKKLNEQSNVSEYEEETNLF